MIDWTPEIWSGKKFQPIRTKFLKKETKENVMSGENVETMGSQGTVGNDSYATVVRRSLRVGGVEAERVADEIVTRRKRSVSGASSGAEGDTVPGIPKVSRKKQKKPVSVENRGSSEGSESPGQDLGTEEQQEESPSTPAAKKQKRKEKVIKEKVKKRKTKARTQGQDVQESAKDKSKKKKRISEDEEFVEAEESSSDLESSDAFSSEEEPGGGHESDSDGVKVLEAWAKQKHAHKKGSSGKKPDDGRKSPSFDVRAMLGDLAEESKFVQEVTRLAPALTAGRPASGSRNESQLWRNFLIKKASSLEAGDVLVHAAIPMPTLDTLTEQNEMAYWEIVSMEGMRVSLIQLPAVDRALGPSVELDPQAQVLCLRGPALTAIKSTARIEATAGAANGSSKKMRESTWIDPKSGKSYILLGEITHKNIVQMSKSLSYRRLTDEAVLASIASSVLDIDTSTIWAQLMRAAASGYWQSRYRQPNLAKYPFMKTLPVKVADDYLSGLEPGTFIGINRFSLVAASTAGDNGGQKFALESALRTLEQLLVFVHGVAYDGLFQELRRRLTEGDLHHEEWDHAFLRHRIDEELGHMFFVLASYSRAEFTEIYPDHSLGYPTAVAAWITATIA